MVVETIYATYDNTNVLQLKDDSETGAMQASDFSSVTKVEIVFDDTDATKYNSTDDSTIISYSADGKVTLKLGNSALPVGSYLAYFVVYDPANENGIRWEPIFRVRKK